MVCFYVQGNNSKPCEILKENEIKNYNAFCAIKGSEAHFYFHSGCNGFMWHDHKSTNATEYHLGKRESVAVLSELERPVRLMSRHQQLVDSSKASFTNKDYLEVETDSAHHFDSKHYTSKLNIRQAGNVMMLNCEFFYEGESPGVLLRTSQAKQFQGILNERFKQIGKHIPSHMPDLPNAVFPMSDWNWKEEAPSHIQCEHSIIKKYEEPEIDIDF